MTSHDTTDRETLSALFDGELQGDARRFAARRLAHDTGWQEDCGRWQLMGDVMRRQAPIAAPADFAARVERAVAADAAIAPPVIAPLAAATSTRRPVRLWAGGALAASVALMAVLATRSPQAVTTAPTAVASTSAVSAPVASTPSLPVAAAETDAAPAAVAIAEPSAPLPAAASAAPTAKQVAAAEPAASSASRTFRRASSRAVEAAPAVVMPQRAASAVLAAATFTAPDANNPFHVPAADPLASRPWPRAAVSAGGALTASYGAQESHGESPSFYPFEPRTHADAAARAESP